MKKYDFIIAGGGMAGLSLAYYLSQSPLRDRSVLLLDRDDKSRNDRTWCFWELKDQPPRHPFSPVLFCTWNQLSLHGTNYTGLLGMKNYRYNMLRGIDFYEFVKTELGRFPNFEFRQATIQRITDTPQGAVVLADDESYTADYVFDSTISLDLTQPQNHNLYQHFKGWFIQTEKPCFNPEQVEIMDFRVEQHGDCRFMYILPFDEKNALVEYTLFNDYLLPADAYETEIRRYIDQFLEAGSYQIQDTEYGVIPMSDVPIDAQPSKHVVRIGTSGGFTKPSTGYTFLRSQRYLQTLVQNLISTGKPTRPTPLLSRRFSLYDSIFLNVLAKKRHPANDVFTQAYVANPGRIFKFLDEDTTFTDELRLFATMPFQPFVHAFFDVLRRKLVH